MAQNVEKHCQECLKCQQSKQPKPTRAPMTSIPIGRPWKMIAVDILELPVSSRNNIYLLVIQDYFTKWAEAIPMKDQTASRITNKIVKVCSLFGIPKILHSDQGRNFESTILRQTLQVLVSINPVPQLIIRKVMDWLKDSTDHCYNYFGLMLKNKKTGKNTCQ